MNNIFLFLGNDEYAKNSALSAAVSHWLGQETAQSMAKELHYGEELKWESVAGSYETVSMFSAKKSIVIRSFDRASQESQANLVNVFKNPSEETGVFITAEKIDKRLSHFKTLKKIATISEHKLPYSDKIPDWLSQFCRKKFKRMLPYRAAQLLQEYVGDEIGELELELEKIDLSLKPGIEISDEVIQSMVMPRRNQSIFEFLRMMGLGEKGPALATLNNLLLQGEPAFLILIRLFNHYLRLLKIAQLTLEGLPTQEITGRIGLHPFLFKKENYLKQSKSRSIKKWQSLLAQISQLELNFKTGKYAQRHEAEIVFAGLI